MNQRAGLLVQILEKLGAPLMAAVNAVSQRSGSGADPARDAGRVAELLARSVQVGVALSESTGLRNGGDSVRLALAAIGAQLLGGHYRQTGKMPGEADVKRLTTALEAVLTFADNFEVAADNIARLENLAPGDVLADSAQINIQYVGLFVPVVTAVARFPFGQPERKLVQDIATRLMATAEGIARRAGEEGGGDARAAKQTEMQVLRGLVALYAACHTAETERLMAMDAAARSSMQSLDAVWKAFDAGAVMLEILAGGNVPESPADTASASGGGGFIPAPASPPPQQAQQALQQSPPPVDAKVAPENQPGYNPMSFFKPPAKKGDEV